MKRYHLLGLTLVAVVIFSAVIAATASAATFLLAEWLLNGAAITTLTSTTTTETILLEDEKVPIAGKVAVVCAVELDGSVGANGEGEITEVLNVANEKIELGKTELSCEKETGCEEAGKAAPIGLPWDTELQLEEPSLFRNLFLELAGYEFTCKVFGVGDTDSCTVEKNSGDLLTNGTGDVTVTAETIAPNGNCSLGGNGSAKEQVIAGLITTLTGTLSVSE